MKSFLNEYVLNYNRIVLISDHKSYIASDIIYENIIRTMNDMVNHKNKFSFSLNPKDCKLYTYDEFDINTVSNNYGIPRRMIFDNIFKKIQSNDVLVLRCAYYNKIGGNGNIIQTTPLKVGYNAELIIGIVNNKLTIVKDRYGPDGSIRYNNYDLRNLGKSYKLDKILKRINNT
jgi:hypothetical protein